MGLAMATGSLLSGREVHRTPACAGLVLHGVGV
jgi:hypothetical protein